MAKLMKKLTNFELEKCQEDKVEIEYVDLYILYI